MDGLLKMLVDFKIIDACILLLGVFGVALIVERGKTLYFDYSIKAEEFMKKVLALVEQDKVEEAITLCAANEKKPLAHVIKRMLERSDRDDAAVSQSLDIAATEVGPGMTKNMGYLQMVSNVVTLVGLLGTVMGLIMSFQAVSFADPSQKQALLADGISVAMHATMLALSVAIPVMIAYSFLHAKQGRLFGEIDQWSNKTIELLKARGFDTFSSAAAFPTTLGVATETKKVKMPPGPMSA